MQFSRLLLVSFFMLAAAITVGAQSLQAQQPPSLVADSGRNVSATRGGSAQSFQITSAILKETRRILIVLPASFSQSAPDRRYPLIGHTAFWEHKLQASGWLFAATSLFLFQVRG